MKAFFATEKCRTEINYTLLDIHYYTYIEIPVTSHEGPQGCEMSRLQHFKDNRLTDGGEVVSLRHRPPFTPRKIPGTHFC
jgi:hypothetical protein